MEYMRGWFDIPQVVSRYAAEYLALIQVGASHEEAVAQIAQSNEVDVAEVEVECDSHWAA